ncbi:MAG: HIT family protein [Chthoniobacterales bacterium]
MNAIRQSLQSPGQLPGGLKSDFLSDQVSTLYLFKEQTYRGRCIVAYRDHVNELFELSDSDLALYMQDVAKAARAMKEALGADKINYGAYSDKLAHLHFHLVPKYEDGPRWGTTFTMMPEPKSFSRRAGPGTRV